MNETRYIRRWGEEYPVAVLAENGEWLMVQRKDQHPFCIKIQDTLSVPSGKPAIKCEHCSGNGSYVICAGDGEWSEDCEACNGTGFGKPA